MLASLNSATIIGVQALPVEVEVYVGHGFMDGAAVVVGLPDAAVKESRDRVKAAVENSGFSNPDGKITVNLAPADVRKEGPIFDLPIAIGLLAASEQLKLESSQDYLVVGELALNGAIRPIKGALPMALAAREHGFKGIVLPQANAGEASVVEGVQVYPVENLRQVTDFLSGKEPLPAYSGNHDWSSGEYDGMELDFEDVKGQAGARRAVEVAVAGGHNLLMVGSPGSGKSMLAKRIPSIMPPLTLEEALETTRIHSVVGLLESGESLVTRRPFRSPHHTISDVGLVGGSANPSPGEVSLAHNGVLFLDELPEFKRSTLEVLRQPLEDGKVTISRAAGTFTFPARFMFVAAMNPTPTGSASDLGRGKVSTAAVQRYLNRISGPLLDRIDIHLEVPELKHRELLSDQGGEPSKPIRERVVQARLKQLERFQGRNIWCNAQMGSRDLKEFVQIDEPSREFLRYAMEDLHLSARAYDRILKVSRTIADLGDCADVASDHIAEAISYRSLDRQLWG